MKRLLLIALVAVPALADEDKERAKQLLDEGAQLYEARDWEAALEKFEEAYRVYPSPVLLINIGKTYRELERPVEALDAYERFLREAGPEVPAGYRKLAQDLIAALEQRVGLIAFDAPEGTEISLDGVAIGTVPLEPVRAKVGLHKVGMVVPDKGPSEFVVEVKAQDATTARPPKPAPPALPASVEADARLTQRPVPPKPFYKRWYVLTGAAAVVAGAVVAGVLLAKPDPQIPDGATVIDTRTNGQ